MKNDSEMKRAIFAWHLIWDAAFLRSCLTFGYKTFTEVLADLKKHDLDNAHTKKWLKLHQKYDKKITLKQLFDPARWAIANDDKAHQGCVATIDDMLEQYEKWIWQITHWFIYPHKHKRREHPIYRELRRALAWQVSCDSQRDHMQVHLYDFDRLMKQGQKLSPDDLRTRSIIAHMPVCVEDHPTYPQEMLGTMNDEVIAKNLAKTLADAKKKATKKKAAHVKT